MLATLGPGQPRGRGEEHPTGALGGAGAQGRTECRKPDSDSWSATSGAAAERQNLECGGRRAAQRLGRPSGRLLRRRTVPLSSCSRMSARGVSARQVHRRVARYVKFEPAPTQLEL